MPHSVQVLELKSRLDGLLRLGNSRTTTATEAITVVTREHAALRDCLGDVERVKTKREREPEREGERGGEGNTGPINGCYLLKQRLLSRVEHRNR